MKKIYVLLFVLSTASARLTAQCTTPVALPYTEGFSNITANNQLPACWAVSNVNTCQTFTGGASNTAAFYYAPAGDNYFYTNAFQFNAGVTYSTNVTYKTINSSVTWTNFSLLVGPSQSTTGLVSIASTGGPVTNVSAAMLGGTFTVPTSGIYYVAIKGSSNGSSNSPNLLWDDLNVFVPCFPQFTNNRPNLSVTYTTSANYCMGDTVRLTASGADSYSWTTYINYATGPTFTVVPTFIMTVLAAGTNSLSGCNTTSFVLINPNPQPTLAVLSVEGSTVCANSVINLQCLGASTATWSTGQQGLLVLTTLTATTDFSVTGTNLYGCTSSKTLHVAADPAPVFSVSLSPASICAGASSTITANGAASYQWSTDQGTFLGNPFIVTPLMTTTITVTGTGTNSCTTKMDYVLKVDACTGLNQLQAQSAAYTIYPNPGNGTFVLSSENSEIKNIVVSDALGKIVFERAGNQVETTLDLNHLATGIYQVQVSSGASVQYLKLVKQ